MRAYKVSVSVYTTSGEQDMVAFAGTQGDASKSRQTMANDYGVKKSAIAIEEIDIPTDKAGLLAFINGLV